MLRKLVKYEFMATGRLMLIFYGALLLISIVNAVTGFMLDFSEFNGSNFLTGYLPVGISWFLYGISIAAVCVLTLIMIIQRFYKNLLQNEGYLMHVLPVKTWKHIASKLMVAIVWSVASLCMVIVSIMIVAGIGLSDLASFFSIVGRGIGDYIEYAGMGSFILVMVQAILIFFATAALSVLKLYASMAIGQLADKHKILAAFGAYVVINVAESIIEVLLLQGGVFVGYNIADMLSDTAVLNLAMFGLLAMTLVEAVACFIVTEILMRKKLNLA